VCRVFGSGPVSWRANWTSVGVGFYDLTGESIVVTAEPAGFWTGAKFALPYEEEARTWHNHRGRVVSLLFDIVP